MRRSSSLLVVLCALIAACAGAEVPTPTVATLTNEPPAATLTPTSQPRVMSDAQAWAEVRSSLPAAPIILPTWLPPAVDRTRVEVRVMGSGPQGSTADPRYEVAYVAPGGASLVIALGPTPDVRSGDSAIGTRVRNSGAALIYVGGWPATSGAVVTRKVRWVEGNNVLRIESERFSGDDLLHVAWTLDRTGAPALKNPYTRVKPGVCAAQGAAPEETVQRLFAFVGAGDRDAVVDCFALELLGESPYPGIGGWADLPRASDVNLRSRSEVGGRVILGVSWRFASDPGGPWNQQASHFFSLGSEDGAWRVYETATAMYAPPP